MAVKAAELKSELDDPGRIHEIRATIERKPALRALYLETYEKFLACLKRTPEGGKVIEIGSGGGFLKKLIPELLTSDILPYEGVDIVADAAKLPLPDNSVRAIFLMNVFHHLPDCRAFLSEVSRCLVPGGRLFMLEPYSGAFSKYVYRYIHHEPLDMETREWKFVSSGPLSDANSALPWMVFERDREIFEREFPRLRIEQVRPHTPLRYWFAGGLKPWTLIPRWGFGLATALDDLVVKLARGSASFVDIELRKEA